MAIYSLHHTPVGKSTQAQPYTAAAHIGYITRKNALSAIRQARFPGRTPREIANYLRTCEDQDRKNARVLDKVMLALPCELSPEQQIGLVHDFAEHVTRGRALWLAAFHAKGKDVHNPHCHLVIRDRDPKTGKRVIGTSEIGSTERLRRQWEDYANRALSRAGHEERIDRRTLEAQGIQRMPTIHEGPQSQAMDRRGVQPKSRSRLRRNRPGSRRTHRDVDYRAIDKGKSRPQVNRARRAGQRETEREYWDAIDQDKRQQELATLRAIHNPHPEGPRELSGQPNAKSRQPKLLSRDFIADRNKTARGRGERSTFSDRNTNDSASVDRGPCPDGLSQELEEKGRRSGKRARPRENLSTHQWLAFGERNSKPPRTSSRRQPSSRERDQDGERER